MAGVEGIRKLKSRVWAQWGNGGDFRRRCCWCVGTPKLHNRSWTPQWMLMKNLNLGHFIFHFWRHVFLDSDARTIVNKWGLPIILEAKACIHHPHLWTLIVLFLPLDFLRRRSLRWTSWPPWRYVDGDEVCAVCLIPTFPLMRRSHSSDTQRCRSSCSSVNLPFPSYPSAFSYFVCCWQRRRLNGFHDMSREVSSVFDNCLSPFLLWGPLASLIVAPSFVWLFFNSSASM